MESIAWLHISVSALVVLLLLYVCNKLSQKLRPHGFYIAKSRTYESGAEPMGNARGGLKSNLYVLGLVFLLFELETILLLPFALIYANSTIVDPPLRFHLALCGTVFILILGIGWVYVIRSWKNIMSQDTLPIPTDMPHSIPAKYYERINEQYARKLDNPHLFTTRHE